jgi:hypothetical protein
MLVILCGSLTLLAGFLTAALLLDGLRGRFLILLPGLALVMVFPFMGTPVQRPAVRVRS